ncbi:Do family serine endopeptidase [Stenotrophomonas cyclobalanopsidis]|uniref:Probable periplasmic serine endoprotease DegP-like n=1 Tax=Stenotrophomonas cyclobalanopsidis TaxID=2771362 RepID=A0ABQ6T0G6_9GAMM|nr:Do family serine endopeptidase [Stenotrophomonas cyclobalanopsidis]KAA8997827.1 Do family serine endopeptidase [Stenotrophomonas cyclobalanopsidis]
MTHRLRTQAMGLLALTLPLVACAQPAAPAAPQAAPAVAAAPRAPAQPLVSGLPDFTNLVEQVGPGVVNVDVTIVRNNRQASRGPMGDDDMPEFFRRFFGPDFPMPGQGQGGQDGGPSIKGRGMGSGFIISPDGYVLTNYHVVADASDVKVKLGDSREFTAKVVGSDQQYDVALLKIDGRNLPTVRVGDSNTLKPGQWVVAIGSPFGLDHSVTAGVVSAVGRSTGGPDQRYVPFIQTDVAINQGNSGGPLLNTRGEVVGINSQIFSASGGYMGISFAIPIDLAMSAVEQIKKSGKVTRGQIGVALDPRPIDATMAKGLGMSDTQGALVNEVVPGSPSANAGLQPMDVIRSVNNVQIRDASQVPPMIGVMAPGSSVVLDVLRDGKQRSLKVVVGAESSQAEGGNARGDGNADRQPGVADRLGLSVEDIDAPTQKQLGLKSGGVRITQAAEVARDAGLVRGLVITQVGRTPVRSASQFTGLVSSAKAGDAIVLLVYNPQNGASRFVALTAK